MPINAVAFVTKHLRTNGLDNWKFFKNHQSNLSKEDGMPLANLPSCVNGVVAHF